MCQFISGFLMETGAPIISQKSDSHTEIAVLCGVQVEMGGRCLALAFEVIPPLGYPFAPADQWRVVIEDREPQWYQNDREGAKQRIIDALPAILDRKVFDGRDAIIHGSCSIAARNCTVTIESKKPNITIVQGANVIVNTPPKCGYIYADNATGLSLPLVTECGYIYASESTGLSLPLVTKCGNIYASNTTGLSLPLVTECGDIYARNTTGLSLPLVTECGYIYASNATGLSLPLVTECGCIYASGAVDFYAPLVGYGF